MPEFLKLVPAEQALNTFLAAIPENRSREPVKMPTAEALGRVLGQQITAPHPLPPFPRTTVDGYAVRAADSFGASASLPAYLEVTGEIQMGAVADLELQQGQAALIHTGGMLPPGADAVVMIEDTQAVSEREIEVFKPVSSGQNVLQEGEDVQAGDVILEAGTQLRGQEIGGLMALGFTNVTVAKAPTVAILSTGDEVVDPSEEPKPGQVRDINSHTLSAIVKRAGGEPVRYGIIPDELSALRAAAEDAHKQHELVLITAGSSVSHRDITAEVIAQLGKPGILVHGVAIKPGKPTILAVCEGVPVVGLPGNPVSAYVVAGLFVAPAIRRILGSAGARWPSSIQARLQTNVSSKTGREDFLPVQLEMTSDGVTAIPVFGRSNLIFTLVRADGLVRIPPEATGLDAGETVHVRLF
jgi:molybdopterin molybdotransferase